MYLNNYGPRAAGSRPTQCPSLLPPVLAHRLVYLAAGVLDSLSSRGRSDAEGGTGSEPWLVL